MKFTDIFVGLFLAFDCFLPLYAILLSVNYMGSRDQDGDLSYSRFVGLLICTIGFAVLAPKNFAALSGVVSIASFAVFSILGLVTLVFLGLDMYRKANGGKNKGSLVIAVVIAVYVILVVFEPLDPERSRPEIDFPDPEDYVSQYATDDYHDGFIDGFGDGFSAAYKELTGVYP